MRLRILNVLSCTVQDIEGSNTEVESAVRKAYPDVCSQLALGDLGAVVYEVSRLGHLAVHVLQGPLPLPLRPARDPISYGMHPGDDGHVYESDTPLGWAAPFDPGPADEHWDDPADDGGPGQLQLLPE